MAVSYYTVADVLFKILFQSCCIEVVKNGEISFVRSKLLILYSMSILAVPFYIFYKFDYNNSFLTVGSIINFIFLILSTLSWIINDVEYQQMLALIKRTKIEICSSHTKTINWRIIFWIVIIHLCHLIPLLNVMVRIIYNYFFVENGDHTIYPNNMIFLINDVSFAKLAFILEEFADVSKELNKQTRTNITDPIVMKKMGIAQTKLEEMFLDLNKIVNPALFVNLAVNFMFIFLQPYFILESLWASNTAWSFNLNLMFLGEILKLCLISRLCQNVNSEIAKWWTIVESAPGSYYNLLEMDRRGIVPHPEKSMQINVYNMFHVNTIYLRMVLLTTLSYAFIVMQSAPSFDKISTKPKH